MKMSTGQNIERTRVFWKKWCLCLLALAVIVSCAVSCGRKSGAGENAGAQEQSSPEKKMKRIPLRIMFLPDPRNPSDITGLATIKAFREKYPYIDLSAFSGISIQGMVDDSKIMLAVAGGNAPDVFSYIPFRMSDTFIQQGFLYPLDSFLERDYPGGLDAFMEHTPEPIRPVLRRDGPAIKGNKAGNYVWGLPGDLGVRVLFWRKDLFAEAGLDPERPPQDWDELYLYARKLSDPARNRYGMNMTSGMYASWDFMAFLWSAGGEAVVKNEEGEWVAAFGSPEAAKALDFYTRLATEEWVDSDGRKQHGYTVLSAPASDTNGDTAWKEGRVGMTVNYLNSSSMGGDVDSSVIGIGPFPPMVKGGKSGTELNAILCGVFSGIEGRYNSDGEWVSPEEIREAAWKYTQFMNSDEADRIRADVLVASGMGRVLSPLWLRKFGYEEYLKYFPEELEQVYNDAIANGKPEPFGKNCQMVYSFMTEPLDAAMQLARDRQLPEDEETRLALLQQLLQKSSEKTTIQMIGKLSPEERARRNFWAVIVSICICALFCYAIYRTWIIFSPKDSYSGKRRGWDFRKNALGYLIMIPALVSI